MNMIVTHHDVGRVALGAVIRHLEYVDFDEPDTLAAGTILARDESTQRLVPFEPGDVAGRGTPLAVLEEELESEAAGPVRALVIVSGKVSRQRLIIHSDGDGSGVDRAVVDGLASFTIEAVGVQQLTLPPRAEEL
jgi:hypothetical protein